MLFTSNELMSIFNAEDNFANKWVKSANKVLINGTRMTGKRRPLASDFIEETNSYNYLGLLINRFLIKDNRHNINCIKPAIQYTLTNSGINLI